jgi:uncharacterized membrane protein
MFVTLMVAVSLPTGALVVGAAATWAMVGVIWIVQLLQYPMLAQHSAMAPGAAAQEHQRRISYVVGPLMAVELVTAAVLLFDRPDSVGAIGVWLAAALLAAALLSTAMVQVPLHRRLAEGHDDEAARRLISSNWFRTAAWTARGVVLAVLLLG